MERKIAFFDIDGTLTSELDGSVPLDTALAIREARANGHLMFLNTGRCMQNVEARFREVGFDGYVCGCGTDIYCTDEHGVMQEILYVQQNHDITAAILHHSRRFAVDILFESRNEVRFDTSHPLLTQGGTRQYNAFVNRHYDMSHDLEAADFTCDKFVVWFQNIADLPAFRAVSDQYFDCIDRGGNFREFVPIGYSKATGIQRVLDYYGMALDSAYCFGDSNNDLPMLSYVPHSIAMGNATPDSLFSQVSYVTGRSSEGGIRQALRRYSFIP